MCGQRSSSVVEDALVRVDREQVQVVPAHAPHGAKWEVVHAQHRVVCRVGRPGGLQPGSKRRRRHGHAGNATRETTDDPGVVTAGVVEREGGAGFQSTGELVGRSDRPPSASAAATGAGTRSSSRRGCSIMNAAAMAAMIEAATPIQKVWATARLKAWWMPATMLPMNGSTAPRNTSGMPARMAVPRSPTPVSWLKSMAPVAVACPKPATTGAGTSAAMSGRADLIEEGRAEDRPDDGGRDRTTDLAEERQVGGGHPELAVGHRVLDHDREDRERGSDAETGEEHPEPHHDEIGIGGELGHQRRRDPHDRDRTHEQPLVVARSRHDEARHDRGEDQPDHQRAGPRGPSSVGEKPWTNWNQRGQEDDRAEEREAREERRDHRARVGPVSEQVERDDRLLGARLGQDEEARSRRGRDER